MVRLYSVSVYRVGIIMAMSQSKVGRIVGVDFGTKRVGLAVADPLRMFAQPHGAFDAKGAVDALKEIEARDDLAVIVVGWPLLPSGEEGKATERVQQYINRLRNAFPGVEVVTRDERYTSEMAKDVIREVGIRRSGRPDKGRVDAAAAAIILQDYLDGSDEK